MDVKRIDRPLDIFSVIGPESTRKMASGSAAAGVAAPGAPASSQQVVVADEDDDDISLGKTTSEEGDEGGVTSGAKAASAIGKSKTDGAAQRGSVGQNGRRTSHLQRRTTLQNEMVGEGKHDSIGADQQPFNSILLFQQHMKKAKSSIV